MTRSFSSEGNGKYSGLENTVQGLDHRWTNTQDRGNIGERTTNGTGGATIDNDTRGQQSVTGGTGKNGGLASMEGTNVSTNDVCAKNRPRGNVSTASLFVVPTGTSNIDDGPQRVDATGRQRNGLYDSRDNNNFGQNSTIAEPWAHRSMLLPTERQEQKSQSVTTAVAVPAPTSENTLPGKDVLVWTAEDVRTWLRTLPGGLPAFAQAEAFLEGKINGKRLATLTKSNLRQKEFHHEKCHPKKVPHVYARL